MAVRYITGEDSGFTQLLDMHVSVIRDDPPRRGDVKGWGRGGEHRGSELGDAWQMKLFFFFFFFGASQGKPLNT